MQKDLEENRPDVQIQILGINQAGWEDANTVFTSGRDLPWLQDQDIDSDAQSDVWNSWGIIARDVVVLDANNLQVGIYNLEEHSLEEQANYDTLRQMLVDAATIQTPWHNSTDPMDVNGDGLRTPVGDILVLVNELNLRTICDEFGQLPTPPTGEQGPPPYYDVSGDNYLTPAQDVLPLINYSNELSAGEGEATTLEAPKQQILPFILPSSSISPFSENGAGSESSRIRVSARDTVAVASAVIPPTHSTTSIIGTFHSEKTPQLIDPFADLGSLVLDNLVAPIQK